MSDTHRDLDTRWDVVVVGAGPAGCATALSSARHGVPRVGLIDSQNTAAERVGETIPPDTRLLVEELGLWQEFAAQEHRSCLGSCSSWGSETLGYNDFLLNPQGFGWHLDRRRFDAMLLRAATERDITVLSDTRCLDVEPARDGGFRLRLATGNSTTYIETRFVVDATGSGSRVARCLGVRQAPVDRLVFVYGFLDAPPDTPASRLTLLEAVPDGWWYAAHLPGGRLAVALATDAEVVRRRRLTAADVWLRAALATRHLAPRLDGCRLPLHGLVVRSAPTYVLESVAGPGWLAVGDAAATYDPLMSQGVHKALSDGIHAGAAVADAVADAAGVATGLTTGVAVGASTSPPTRSAGDYAGQVLTSFEEYLANRAYFYGLERRWPRSDFWQRRRRTQVGPGPSPRRRTHAA